jgi:predicted dehydrogenase/threonine dehydrogenase-like Zn-dependent dehydrogenase
MKQVLLSGQGQIEVLDVPVPLRASGGALVRTRYSLISSGTEAAAVASRPGWLGVLEKARRSPAKVQKVWQLARTRGLSTTWDMLRTKLADYVPLGYSAVGEVVEVDDTGGPFAVGQTLACLGSGVANHAEYLAVPENLAVPLPPGVPLDQAAFGAVGCIGMQGIRRLDAQPGEWIGVIGLGLIGQVTIRLLRAMGYEVCGADIVGGRVDLARAAGIAAWPLDQVDSAAQVLELTGGRGLDGVIVCAATASNEPVNLAFDLCRQRGRVSIVGDVGLDLKRDKMYRKELELRISTSYGPGRYDPEYEDEGRDYPYGLVRWTSRRNLEHFLRLLSERRLDLGPLVSAKFDVSHAAEAYARVKAAAPEDYGVLFDYPSSDQVKAPARVLRSQAAPLVISDAAGPVRLGLIGVGDHAKTVHLPNLRKLSDRFVVAGVASRTGAAAAAVARRYTIPIVATDYMELLNDPAIEAVLISTRHASHAAIAVAALQAGKHVFVEKPLAITLADAEAVCDAAKRAGKVVRVGFNRRFSPWLSPLREVLDSPGRRAVTIRVNVGNVGDHWSSGVREGGRLMGEGVHFLDLANWLLGEVPIAVSATFLGAAETVNPNATIHIGYADGSVASLLYTTVGASELGKERFEVFGNGQTAFSDDYQAMQVFGRTAPAGSRARGDKGHLAALAEFAGAVRGQPGPVRGAQARDGLLATWMVLAAYESATTGNRVSLVDG